MTDTLTATDNRPVAEIADTTPPAPPAPAAPDAGCLSPVELAEAYGTRQTRREQIARDSHTRLAEVDDPTLALHLTAAEQGLNLFADAIDSAHTHTTLHDAAFWAEQVARMFRGIASTLDAEWRNDPDRTSGPDAIWWMAGACIDAADAMDDAMWSARQTDPAVAR